MNLIDENNRSVEIGKINDFIARNCNQYSFKTIRDCESYFDDFEDMYSIKEYNYNNPLELKAIFDDMWNANDKYIQDISLALSVGAFKNKNKVIKKKEISQYIYEF